MTVYEVPGLCGLELWRGVAGGATLFALREHKPDYFEGLREFLVRLHQGEAAADEDRETEALRRAAGFARAILCGGDALHPGLAAVLGAQPLPFAVEIDSGGPYAAKRGALRVFRSMEWRRGVALDLGQSQLKVMTGGANWSIRRDTSRLPFGAHSIEASDGQARLRELIQQGLSRVEERPDGIVLALPVALGRDGIAQPASYPGLFGPVQPIFSGLFRCPSVVLNDAVLAALGFPPNPREKTLVVTLGFGIGGALWAG